MSDASHTGVVGLTRYGKTYFCKDQFLKFQGAGIYFNPRSESVKGTVGIDRNSGWQTVKAALHSNYKLTYKLSGDLVTDRKDINKLINLLMMEKWRKPIMLVFDEAQDFAYQGDLRSGLLRVARTGLGQKIVGVFNCQRPADLSKIVLSQCERKIFFAPAPEDEIWIKQKNYPLDAIKAAIKGQKYKYCEYYLGQLSGAKTVYFRGEL